MKTMATYLDYNATAPLRPESRAAMAEAFSIAGNPSSVHRFGRRVRALVEDAREQVAALIGAESETVVFTSGGTEANALALRGSRRDRILATSIEHDSVLAIADDQRRITVDSAGEADPESVDELLGADGSNACVAIMLANNETGVLQPVGVIAERARRRGAILHCDAVQAFGKIAVDWHMLGADLMAISAHKIGGPAGVGALVVRDGIDLAPMLGGGGQERRRRAGTENWIGIIGFGAAAEAAARDLDRSDRFRDLRDRMEKGVRAMLPTATIAGAVAPRLPNTSCIVAPGMAAETQIIALDLAGVAVSAGSACSSGKVAASHVLRAMGYGEEEAGAAIRVSMGWATAPADVDHFLSAYRTEIARRIQRSDAA